MKTLLALGFLFASTASAGVIYHFDFSSLNNGRPDFSLEVFFPDYIQTTGLAPLGNPLPTPLGYNVNNFGENALAWFGFSETGGLLQDDGFTFSVTSFLFEAFPIASRSGYITEPGRYVGRVDGNAPFSFNGIGVLTVTEVPELSTWIVVFSALPFVWLRRARAVRQV
jgi:hypothetical protein